MASTNINIRTDSELKAAAEKIFEEFGLNMSSAINMFLKQAVRINGIPFELKLELPNAETKAALDEYPKMKANTKSYPRYNSFNELLSEVAEDACDYKVK